MFVLSGCGPRPGPSTVDQARLEFSRSAFCPMPRVSAGRTIELPHPPAPIASDPERLAMWRATWEREAMEEPRQTIAVSGCGERAEYACWALVGQVRVGRALRTVYYGSSCNQEAR